MAILTGQKEPPPSIFEALYQIDPKESIGKVKTFSSGEEFNAMWAKINGEN